MLRNLNRKGFFRLFSKKNCCPTFSGFPPSRRSLQSSQSHFSLDTVTHSHGQGTLTDSRRSAFGVRSLRRLTLLLRHSPTRRLRIREIESGFDIGGRNLDGIKGFGRNIKMWYHLDLRSESQR